MSRSQTNGEVERFLGILKYEHLFRAITCDGNALAVEINQFGHTYNALRPTRHWTTGRRDRRTSPAGRASSHRSGRPSWNPYPDGSSAVKNRIDPAGTPQSARNTASRDPWVARSPR
ncbi:hypothetical protein E4K73_50700 [Streptomyces sp. IB201691-2A2]|nr:hypothetical protein E4K73_50700 [Streptomyces sp. IB201691-2A2]